MSPAVTERLESHGIRVVSQSHRYVMLVRDQCLAIVGVENGVCSIGSTGLLTEDGLAYLVLRGEREFLMAKGRELPALPEQIEAIRKFSDDVKAIVR